MNALRRLALASLFAGALPILSACGGGGDSDDRDPPVAPVTLTVTHTVRITTSLGVI